MNNHSFNFRSRAQRLSKGLVAACALALAVTSSTQAAPPEFVSRSLGSDVNDVNNLSIFVPQGEVGDLLVAAIGTDNAVTFTTPAGWNLINAGATAVGGGETAMAIYWRIATGTEPVNQAFTWNNINEAAGTILRYRDVIAGAPIHLVSGPLTGNNTLPNAPAITPTVNDTVILRFAASDDNEQPVSPNDPTGHTLRAAVQSDQNTVLVSELPLPTAAAVPADTFDLTTGTAEAWRTISIAIASPIPTERLAISKSSNGGTGRVSAGQILTYTIDVENTGSSAASNVVVTDLLPTGVTYQVATTLVSYNGGGAVAGNPPPTLVAAGDGYTLAPADTLQITFDVQVDNPISPAIGTFTNSTTIAASGFATNYTAITRDNSPFWVAGPEPLDTFYIPLPEDQGLVMLRGIYTQANCGGGSPDPVNPMATYISLTVLREGTIIYYDHWEDGFEAIENAPTGTTTEVWGNGVVADGAPPGCFTDECDVLQAGQTIIMENLIDTTNMLTIDFDGGDRISATDIISMSRAEWATGSATLLAGALEMYPVERWGTNYEVPVGTNQFSNANNPYEYTGLAIMAQEDNTTIMVDIDADGFADVTTNLFRGESYQVDGGVLVGATVDATSPVQVSLLTGDICTTYESRFMTLFPTDQWSTTYLNPVSAGPTGDPTIISIYNPEPTNMVFTIELRGGVTTNVTINAGQTFAYTMPAIPASSGAKISAPQPFYAVNAIDSELGGGTTHDWGFSLVPESGLSQQVLVGLGLGEDPIISFGANVSPVWLTAELLCPTNPVDGFIRIYVDYDNDGNDAGNTNMVDGRFGLEYDAFFDLAPLQSIRLLDPDGDQTGMYVFISDPDDPDQECAVIASAWGQDPNVAPGGSPAIDVGTAIPNISAIANEKRNIIVIDGNSDGSGNVGDTVTYFIEVSNIGFVPVSAVSLTDIFPFSYLQYITNTVVIDPLDGGPLIPIPDNDIGATTNLTEFPLDEGGVPLPFTVNVGETVLVSFNAVITNTPPQPQPICNTAILQVNSEVSISTVCLNVSSNTANLGDFVWNDVNGDGDQDAGELGIPGVMVELYDSSSNLVDTVVTASDGSYAFEQLPADTYTVTFIPPPGFEFSPPGQGGDPTLDSDANQTTGEATVTLAQDETNNDIDAGLIQLASIGGSAWIDLNGDGINDANEIDAVTNVTVYLLDNTGTRIATNTTDAAGDYLFTSLAAGDYEVEIDLSTILPGYTATVQGSTGSSDPADSDAIPGTGRTELTSLVAGETDKSWDLGIFICLPPGIVCPPDLVIACTDSTNVVATGMPSDGLETNVLNYLSTPCFVVGPYNAEVTPGTSFTNTDAIVLFSEDAVGNVVDVGYTPPIPLASHNDIGATYGVASTLDGAEIFAAAYLKRGSGFGPGGPGAVYRIQLDGTAPTSVSTFATVPNAGADPHDFSGDFTQPTYDAPVAGLVGKRSLGDIDLSPDQSTIYVVNLNDKHLYSIDAVTGAVTDLGAIPVPAGCLPGEFYPFAVKARTDNDIYIGAVSGDESGSSTDRKRGYVIRYDVSGTSFTQEFDFSYDYTVRGGNNWRDWDFFGQNRGPMLTDIEFIGDDMVIGLRGRFQDNIYDPNGVELGQGDVLRACFDTAINNWVLESGGSCGGVAGSGGTNGPGGGEYFYDIDGVGQPNTAMGGLAVLNDNRIVTTLNDPFVTLSAGVYHFNDAGTNTQAYTVFVGTPAAGTYGKASGLGDLEVVFINQTSTNPPSFVDNIIAGTCGQEQTIERVWTITNSCGEASVCTQTIDVVDNIAPVITCPTNLTIACSDSTNITNTGSATAVDNCDPAPLIGFSDVIVAGACPQEFVINRTWAAVDACGNATQCVQVITVEDNLAPLITDCPTNLLVACFSDVPAANPGGVVAVDNCDGSPTISVIATNTSGTGCVADPGIVRYTYQAIDACGNASTCTQEVTVVDAILPVLTLPPSVTVACDADTSTNALGAASALDNCAGIVPANFADVITPGACPQNFVITRTWTAVDACGNSTNADQVITVQDVLAPVITFCPTNETTDCFFNVPLANPGAVAATDNCSTNLLVSVINTNTLGAGCAADPGIVEYIYQVVDECGNSSTCTQTITVVDNEDPVIFDCPLDQLVQCFSDVPPADPLGVVTIDNCDIAPPVTVIATNISGAGCAADPGIVDYVYQVTDACSNSITCTQRITVVDSIAPVLTTPTNVVVACDADTSTNALGVATAIDNCSTNLLIAFVDSIAPGACPQESTITRTWTAQDECGNIASNDQVITVVDTTPPALALSTNSFVIYGGPNCEASVPAVGFVAPDNCSTNVVVTQSPLAGTLLNGPLVTNIVVTAIDECGNSTQQVATLQIDCFDLALVKREFSGGPFGEGDPVTYTITVTNQGTVAARNIQVVDYLPAGMTLADPNWLPFGGLAFYGPPIGVLAAGASTNIDINFTIDLGFTGAITNYSEIAGAVNDVTGTQGLDIDSNYDTNNLNDVVGGDNVTDNSGGDSDDHDLEAISVSGTFDLALIKVPGSAGPFYAGGPISFDIVVTNQGTQLARDIEIAEYIPTGLTLADAAWTNIGGIAFLNTPIASLAAGASTTVPVNFTIDSNAAGLVGTNYAEIAATDDGAGNPAVDFDSMYDTNALDDVVGGNDITDGTGGDSDDHDLEPFVVETLGYTLVKNLLSPLGRPAVPGEAVTFSITITNTGSVDLITVPVTDTFDDSFLGFVSAVDPEDSVAGGTINWLDVGPIAAGTNKVLTVNFTALTSTQPGVETNSVTTAPTIPPVFPPLPPQTNDVPYEIAVPGYTLVKNLTSPLGRPALLGETVSFDITVTNTGEVDLVTVPVIDNYDPAIIGFVGATAGGTNPGAGVVDWADIGPIAAGTNATVSVDFVALASTGAGQSTNNVVTSPGLPPTFPPLPPSTNDVPFDVEAIGYTLVKSLVSPLGRPAVVGEAVVFDITITNTGEVDLVTVPVTDTFDDSILGFVSAVDPEDSVVGGVITWNDVGPIAAGTNKVLTVNFTALTSTQPGVETNNVVTSPTLPPTYPPLPPQTNDVPYEVTAPGYTLVKSLTSPSGRPALLGETVSFDITVTNTGEVDLVTVPVIDNYDPAILGFVGATAGGTNPGAGVVDWADIGPIVAGSNATVSVDFTALASTAGGQSTNNVVTSPGLPPIFPPLPPSTNDVPFEVEAIGYTLVKSLVSPLGRPAVVGEAVVFDITITNTGEVDIITVPVTDSFDDSFLGFVSAVDPEDSVAGGVITWNDVGPLAAGTNKVLTVNFVALTSTQPGVETNNVVTLPTLPPVYPPLPPQTNDVPYEIALPGYTLVKSLTSPLGRPALLGETVSFDITVTNTGEVDLVTVPVIDNYDPAILGFVGAIAGGTNPGAGVVDWADIGPIAAGTNATVSVDFIALASTGVGQSTNNVVTSPGLPPTFPPLPPSTNDVPFDVEAIGYTLVKSLVSPLGRPAVLGEAVVFDITITNTGEVDLVTVPVTDTFDDSFLSFVSAVDPADSVVGGVINWLDVGPIAAGTNKVLTVNFSALSSTAPGLETNNVVTAPTVPPVYPPVPPQTNDVPYEITDSDYTLAKVLTSPLGRPAVPGEAVTFDITISNNGGVGLVTVPVTDTYDDTYLAFTGASDGGDGLTTSGVIDWADVGPIASGTNKVLSVSFVALTSTQPGIETNTVTTAPTVPPAFPPLPPTTNTAPYEIIVPGYTLVKSLTSPLGRAAAVGELVSFDITVANTGEVDLVTVPVIDNYDPAILGFVGASNGGTNPGAGLVDWADIGPIAAGGDATVSVDFVALTSTQPTLSTNNAVTSPGLPPTFPPLPPTTNDVPFEVSEPGYLLTKTQVTPAVGVVQIGELIEFELNISNTGDVDLLTVPVTDTFDAATLAYLSAVPPADAAGAGTLNWTDVGPIAPGSNATILVSMVGIASTSGGSETNTVATSPTTPPGQPPVPPQTNDVPYQVFGLGQIAGTVFVDENGNGIAETGDTNGITGVTVTLLDGTNVVGTTVTDGSGDYIFTNLLAGTYTVVETDPAGFLSTLDVDGANDNTNTVPLAVEEISVDNDFYDTALASIAGEVRDDDDADGDFADGDVAITNVTVVLLDGSGTPIATNQTDASGAYEFLGLAPGDYTVVETDPSGFESTADIDGPNDNTIDVTLLTGDTSTGNDFLDTAPVNISGTVFVDVNGNGVAEGADTNGIPGVTIELFDGTNLVDSTTTDANGDYIFTNVLAGTYTIVETDLAGYLSTLDVDGANDNTIVTTVTSGVDSIDNDYYDTALASISGQVRDDADADGDFLDGDGVITNVTVVLLDGTGTPIATNVTDASGNYEFLGLAPGDYTVVETDPSGFVSTADIDGPNDNTIDVTLATGETSTGNDFLDTAPVNISGTVFVDVNGNGVAEGADTNGIPGVTIELFDGTNLVDTTTTDANGDYIFTNVLAGTYTIVESDLLGYLSTLDVDGANDNTIVTTVTSGVDSIDNDYYDTALASISGQVRDDDDADGDFLDGDGVITNVTVVLLDGTGTPIATNTTDAAGNYEFLGLAPGDYTVVETDPSGFVSTADVDGPNDNTIDVTLTTGETSTGNDFLDTAPVNISGTVFVDVNGNGVAEGADTNGISGVSISLLDGTNVVDSTTTDANGDYIFTNVLAGTYTIVETDLAGYLSTLDVDGANDNTIVTTVTSGIDSVDNDFYDAIPLVDLALSKSVVTPGPFLTEDLVGFDIRVTNEGVQEARDILVADYIPAGLTLVSPDWTEVAGVAIYNTTIPSLLPGASTNIAVVFQIDTRTDGLSITNEAEIVGVNDVFGNVAMDVDSTPANLNPGEDDLDRAVIDVARFDLALIKQLAPGQAGTVGPGMSIDFRVTLINQGDVAAQNIRVVDYIPAGFALNDADWSMTTNGYAEALVAGPIAAGADAFVDITLEVLASANGAYDNVAEILQAESSDGVVRTDADSTGDDDPTNEGLVVDDDVMNTNGDEDDSDLSEALVVRSPAIGIEKSTNGQDADSPTGPLVDAGSAVVWQYVVRNLGDVALDSVVVIDSDPTVTPVLVVGDANNNGLLDLNETWIYEATGTAIIGQYMNVGAVAAVDPVDPANPNPPQAEDRSHYFGRVATIGDFVWNDLNANGIQELGEPGISNIVINLRDAGGVLQATTTTDANGAYRFDDVIPGDYFVEFAAPTNYVVSPRFAGGFDVDSNIDANRNTEIFTVVGGGFNTSLDAGFYELARLGDTVWVDINRDGVPDENLEMFGIPGVEVELLQVSSGGVTSVVATTFTETNATSRGFFEFDDLVPGTYLVRVLTDNIPPNVRTPTTPLIYSVTLIAGAFNDREDFGFVAEPTAITLASMTAREIQGGVRVQWTTAWENENFGFNIYRSTSINGRRTLVTAQMIAALNQSTGGSYEILDPVTEPGRYFYWLEDIDYDETRTVRGPARVEVRADILASFVSVEQGIVRIETDQPERVGVRIDGQDAASVATDDSVIFYAPQAGSTIDMVLSEAPVRMEIVDADPEDLESVVVPLNVDQTVSFTTEDGVNYFVVGFEGLPVVLDVSAPMAPRFLRGQEIENEGLRSIYFHAPAGLSVEAADE